MKVFIRIFIAALAIAVGAVLFWSLLFVLFSFVLGYFGAMQAVIAVIFVALFTILALIHLSGQGNSPFR